MTTPSPLSIDRERLLGSLRPLLVSVVLSSLLAIAELNPRLWKRLMQEDGWAEWSTCLAFALAAVLGLAAARARQQSLFSRLACLGLAFFCVFVAGEEISWGQRLFGFKPPDYFLERNYQQEANLHNLFKHIFETRYMVLSVALAYGVVAPFLVHITRLPRWLAPELAWLPFYAAVVYLEFSYPYDLVGELAELTLGGAQSSASVLIAQAPTSVPASATRAPGAPRRPAFRAASPAPAPPPARRAELALIRAALTALRDGQPLRALDVLAEHARRFPASDLSRERAGLRVVALCESGRVTLGRKERVAYLQSDASSPLAQRVRNACAGESP